MRCDEVSIMLAEAVDPAGHMTMPAGVHLETCLRCQAELVQYRKLLRELRALRAQHVMPDADLLDELLSELRPLEEVHRLHGHGRRKAYIGGIAAAATAGAAGALVIASRLSRHRLAS